MADICDECGKIIDDNFDKRNDEEDGKLLEFHGDCHDKYLSTE